MNPEYPVYVISKGRWKSQLTSRILKSMNIPHFLVVESEEYLLYQEFSDGFPDLLIFPKNNVGSSVPVRNWVWEHSIDSGYSKHWILDDNIEEFTRLNRNMKLRVKTGAIFKAAEVFTDRYDNIAISGFNYNSFCKSTDKVPPYYLNTRIYSCLLIRNDIPYRWRGKYNEDTDLSLRVLKDGWCTVLFNAFLAGKVTTMRMKGGNTDGLYQDDGRKKMAEALQEAHPDVVKVTWKFGRWHHSVNYKPFKRNKLQVKDGVVLPPIGSVDNYGMVITHKTK